MVMRRLLLLIPTVVIAYSLGCGLANEPSEIDRQIANEFIGDLEKYLKVNPHSPTFAHRARAGRSLLLQIDRTAFGDRKEFLAKVKELKARHGVRKIRLEIGVLKYTLLEGGPTVVLGQSESRGAVRTDFFTEESQDI